MTLDLEDTAIICQIWQDISDPMGKCWWKYPLDYFVIWEQIAGIATQK